MFSFFPLSWILPASFFQKSTPKSRIVTKPVKPIVLYIFHWLLSVMTFWISQMNFLSFFSVFTSLHPVIISHKFLISFHPILTPYSSVLFWIWVVHILGFWCTVYCILSINMWSVVVICSLVYHSDKILEY